MINYFSIIIISILCIFNKYLLSLIIYNNLFVLFCYLLFGYLLFINLIIFIFYL